MAEDDQCSVLQNVNDIKVLSKRAKQISTLKTLYARLTNTESWAEAQQRFLSQATEEKLERFVECDLKKTITKAFQDCCQ